MAATTTPIYDVLDQRLARAVRDPATYVSTDPTNNGADFSAAQRTAYINRANIFLQQTIWGQCISAYGDSDGARNACRRILQSLTKESGSLSFSSSGVSVPTDYSGIPIALAKTSSTASFIYRANKQDLENNVDLNVRHAYTVQGKLVYAYENGVVLNAGTGVLTYIASDQITQHTGTDLLLSVEFHDPLVDLATWYALTETPKPDVAPAQVFLDRAMAFLGRFK
jgi:hypothetical protein